MKSGFLKNTLLFLIGLIIFFTIFYLIGIKDVLIQISKLNVFYYSLAVLCFFFSIFFWSLRWRTFIKSCSQKTNLIEIIRIILIGSALNNMTPVAKIGGEPVRAYLLKKGFDIPMRESLATMISDFTIEFITSVVLVILSVSLIAFYIQPPLWLFIISVVFAFFSLVGLISIVGIYNKKTFVSNFIIWILNKIKKGKSFKENVLRKYRGFQTTLRKNLQDKRLFGKALFFGILIKIFDVLKVYLIFMAIGYEIGVLEIIIIMGISIMLMTIPSTPGSLGILEGGVVSAFVLMGVPVQIAGTFVFLERLLSFWGVTFVGSVLGVKTSIKSLKKSCKKG